MEHEDDEDKPTDQVKVESVSQKRPRTERDPEDPKGESPDKDSQKVEEKPSRSKNLKLFSIFTKPIISFNSKPIDFKSEPNVKNPPKKTTAKAKKKSNKTTGKETKTNNKITNYFLDSTAAADKTNSNQSIEAPSKKIDFCELAQNFADN